LPRVGINVYGYAADPRIQTTWKFQLDKLNPEIILLKANTGCESVKNLPELTKGKHRVVLTPGSNFVLTKFRHVYSARLSCHFHNIFIHSTSVTQEDEGLKIAEIVGIAIGGAAVLLAVPGVYFGYKEWSRRKKQRFSWICC